MIGYIIRRTLYMIPLLFLVSLLAFTLIHIMPGDYYTRLQLNPYMTQETLAEMRARLGLDQPFIVQYWLWLKPLMPSLRLLR